MSGRVYLVGAGPGDPELLTRKGARVLAIADAVLYDNLANAALLDLAPPHAERIYVGKKRSAHSFSQDEIVALLIEHARRGQTVVRLKGGDPFIFGRGGEEIEGLLEAGIGYEVVPGVTTPLGIAAYTGVPLTHREHSSVVTFVTGHEIDSIDWKKSCLTGTVVVFMGLHHLEQIVGRMLEAGRSPDTPAMAVRWATRPDQQTVTARLSDLPQVAANAQMTPPVTIIIGEVVALHDRLDWFTKRPLFGQRIVVTRAQAQSSDFSARLRDLGATPVEMPVIELAPLADYTDLDERITELERYDWLVFTSVNAVEHFLARLAACGRDVRAIRGRICAIGPATSNALAAAHLRADLVPDEAISEGVAAAFAGFDLQNARVLIPRAAAAREVIPDALAALGARVDIADAYRNIIPSDAPAKVGSFRGAEWITFTSGSTVKNWLALAGPDSLRSMKIATIGPATSDVVRKHGFGVTAEADPHTTDGLIAAILRHHQI